jgi:hypothetical protein
MNPMPLNDIFGEWYKKYQHLLQLGYSRDEALQELSDVMLGNSEE